MSTSIVFLAAQLSDDHRISLREHFLKLDAADRHLRFGSSLNDSAVLNYVDGIDFERDEVYAVTDDAQVILGAVHIAVVGQDAELGLSVLSAARGQGIGNALFERAVMRLRNRCVREVRVRCLHQNAAMMHLAQKYGMKIHQEGTDREARLELPAATTGTYMLEWLHDRQARYIGNLQNGTRFGQSMLAALPAFAVFPALQNGPLDHSNLKWRNENSQTTATATGRRPD